MTDATHATIATFAMDPARVAEVRPILHDVIVPSVREFPGVVSGHWLTDGGGDESVAVVTFTSREAADAFAQNVRGNVTNQAAVGIELVSLRLVDVEASFLHP